MSVEYVVEFPGARCGWSGADARDSEPASPLVVARAGADVCPADLIDLLRRLAADPESRGFDQLVVLEDADPARFSRTDIQELAELATGLWGSGDFRSAIVASDLAGYGLARMFELRRGRPAGMQRVFRREAEARRWLSQPRDAVPAAILAAPAALAPPG